MAGDRISAQNENACYEADFSKVTISSNVEVIGKNAFANNEWLREVLFDPFSNLKVIGDGAFWGCSHLCEIWIPRDKTKIGDNAFPGCTNLRYVSLANGFTLAGREGFPNSAEIYKYWI